MTLRKAGEKQKDYYIVTLEDVMVTSFMAGAANGSPTITDQFSLNFSKIKWEYKVQDKAGAMVAGGEFSYDLKARKSA